VPARENPGMRVLVAMSGGVDSSVAAAMLADRGHEVVGVTLKLWGGDSDSGCCSVADVEDARRVAQQIGIPHHVFNMAEEFEQRVVGPYVASHQAGRTPNPCIECNRHIKFDLLVARARRMGFDAVATGHHARVRPGAGAAPGAVQELCRGADLAKDQSYVLSMLGQEVLSCLLLPVGEATKEWVRTEAARLGLRTAMKPDSQDVCFIRSTDGRRGFLAPRIGLHPAPVVDVRSGAVVGAVDAVELVTVGQRRGMGHGSDGRRRYVTGVRGSGADAVVLAGGAEDVLCDAVPLAAGSLSWTADPLDPGADAIVQTSAHGQPVACRLETRGGVVAVRFDARQRRVAPGQTIALYDAACPEVVVGAGIAA